MYVSARLTPNLLTQAGAMKVARLNTAYLHKSSRLLQFVAGGGDVVQYGQRIGAEIAG